MGTASTAYSGCLPCSSAPHAQSMAQVLHVHMMVWCRSANELAEKQGAVVSMKLTRLNRQAGLRTRAVNGVRVDHLSTGWERYVWCASHSSKNRDSSPGFRYRSSS